MDIRPIRTKDDHDWALAEISAYMEKPPAEGTADSARFDILCDLVEHYEDKHYPMKKGDVLEVFFYANSNSKIFDPIDHLNAHMDKHSKSMSDLTEILGGNRMRAHNIAKKRRHMSLDDIRAINSEWGIPVDVLIRPYTLARMPSSEKLN